MEFSVTLRSTTTIEHMTFKIKKLYDNSQKAFFFYGQSISMKWTEANYSILLPWTNKKEKKL